MIIVLNACEAMPINFKLKTYFFWKVKPSMDFSIFFFRFKSKF